MFVFVSIFGIFVNFSKWHVPNYFNPFFGYPINILIVSLFFKGDYRMDGRLELVACATDGEIRGFLPSNVEVSSKVFDMASEQESIREMTQKKQNMLLELKNYEENAKLSGSSGSGMQL